MFTTFIQVLVLATPALSATIGGFNFCIGPYALCSSSYCEPISGNTTHATCTCEGPFNGLNLGNTTCKARSESLISTFSNEEQFKTAIQPPLYTFNCKGDNAGRWADCLDAPCSTETGAVVCTCPTNTGANFYLGEKCPKDASETKKICSQLRSTGATGGGLTKIASLLGSFYGKPPSVSTCKTAG